MYRYLDIRVYAYIYIHMHIYIYIYIYKSQIYVCIHTCCKTEVYTWQNLCHSQVLATACSHELRREVQASSRVRAASPSASGRRTACLGFHLGMDFEPASRSSLRLHLKPVSYGLHSHRDSAQATMIQYLVDPAFDPELGLSCGSRGRRGTCDANVPRQ